MRPIIGVTPLYDSARHSYWMLPGYMQALEACGAVPIMLPLTEDKDELRRCLDVCQGLLITGGPDVEPALYGCRRLGACGQACIPRDVMESFLLEEAIARDLPTLGICRGHQLMNAICGGTLYQHIPDELPSDLSHSMKPPYDRTLHEVTVTADTPLAAIADVESFGVNSYHHQGVNRLSPLFRAMATAPDTLVEAIYRPDKRYVVGVQWHPEFLYLVDTISRRLFLSFVLASNGELDCGMETAQMKKLLDRNMDSLRANG